MIAASDAKKTFDRHLFANGMEIIVDLKLSDMRTFAF
jgi:hypothetical protein